jgi:hypothetical protein
MQKPTIPDPTVAWDDVLDVCPVCGGQRLTPASPSIFGLRVCLTCGIVPPP